MEQAISIVSDESTNRVSVSFPKDLLSSAFIERLMDRLKVESIAGRNKMTDGDAEQISEDVKKTWWDKNRTRILDRMK